MRTEIKWVIIIFIVHTLWHLAERFLGLYGPYYSYQFLSTALFLVVYALLVLLALMDLKKSNNGFLNRRHGLISGLFISFVLVALAPIMVALTVYLITPGYFDTMIANAIEAGEYGTYEHAQTEEYNYWSMVTRYMAGYFLVGSLSGAFWAYRLHKVPEPVRD